MNENRQRDAAPEIAPQVASGLDGQISLHEIARTLWSGRWWVLAVALVFTCLGAAYGWLATPWYRAAVVLIATENRTDQGLAAQLSQFGGLAGLAGINIGSADKAEPLAILRSRDFAASFIEKRQLVSVLFADQWDPVGKEWRTRADQVPDLQDAVDLFDRKVRRVLEDRKSGLVTLTIEWTDPVMAAAWANEMASEINRQTRERALATASRNIAYLQSEMSVTNVVSLQQAIGRLLETEMQKLLLARGNEEFSFRVIDKAQVPKRNFRPQRLVAPIGAAVVGALLAMLFLLARESYRRRCRMSGGA